MIGQTEVPAPPDNLLELDPVGVIVFGVCFVAVLVVTYLIANKRAGNATKAGVLLAACCLLLAGCGSYSQARMDRHDATKGDLVYVAERAMQDKLTATELRSKLQTQDTAMLAEQAHKGEGLDKLRKKLEADSDAKVAKLFNGDNGREDPPGD